MFHSFFELMLKLCSLSRMFLSQLLNHKVLIKLQLSKSKSWMKNHVISSFFSILFFNLACFQADQCPDLSVSSTTVRDTWCGAEEKAGVWPFHWKFVPRLSCIHYVSTQEVFRSSGILKETSVEEEPKKAPLQWESGNPLSHMRKTNQWWDAPSPSQIETLRAKAKIYEQR